VIDGLSIVGDYIDQREESLIALHCAHAFADAPRADRYPLIDGRAKIARYGATLYPDNIASSRLPAWLAEIGPRLPMGTPEHVTIAEWGTGATLAPHIDRGGPVICVLALLGDSIIEFESGSGGVRYRFPRRGLMMIAGPARYAYRHSVSGTEAPRISLVFRTVR
jgi:hypothetical protein